MKKNILHSICIAGAILVFTQMGSANNLKTSSLAIAKTESSVKLPTQCQLMFKEAEKLILVAEKQPGTHTQVQKMKNRLSSSKQQILKMDIEMQQKSCDKGLVALNNLKQNIN